ncbi:MAG: glycosyltransferase [Deltaproteobacteria bacterium]|nr:MAG: glycosyltransferase [Deltaproteobacteria bacterium]
MRFSVIVPAYEAEATLPILLDSLSNQSYRDFEVIVADDCSKDGTSEVARSYDCKVIQLLENHGPAYCRNVGAKKARGEVLVFTDSDCCVDRHWLENIQKHFFQNGTEAIMGRLMLRPSTFLGDSISALGFPAGGAIGFDKIWKVDQKGFTDSLSSCNCAVKKDIFWKVGGFDESFPYPGGEDSFLAYNLRRLNYRIRYCPDVLVYHEARDSFRDFLKWQFRRGESSFIFSTKVSNRKDFLSLRIWSTGNIIRYYFRDKKFPMVLFLLCTSLFLQFIGFLLAKHKRESYASLNH